MFRLKSDYKQMEVELNTKISQLSVNLQNSEGRTSQLELELESTKEKIERKKQAKEMISRLLDELTKIKSDKLHSDIISNKCQFMLHTVHKLHKDADYTVKQHSECLTAIGTLTQQISNSVDNIQNLVTGPLTSQIACCMEKCGESVKIPMDFLNSVSGSPVKCPIVTRDGAVESLRDVYTYWKDAACTMRNMEDGVITFAPAPLLLLFRSIANNLGICMHPPFKVQLSQDGVNWDDMPFMDQILVAFKVFKLCSRKEGTERAVVMDESCFLTLNLHPGGLLKLCIDGGYSARMLLMEPFDFGLRLHLQTDGGP